MKKLIKGTLDFRRKMLPMYEGTFARLAEGQNPDALFVACSDSRVVPNVFASTDPGDLFVLRNVGNLIPPYTFNGRLSDSPAEAASIEYALKFLKVKDIVICGHSGCGAMQAVCNSSNLGEMESVQRWLRFASPSYQRLKITDKPNDLSEEDFLSQINVLQQIDHLFTYPYVKQAHESGRLRVHGWWFNIRLASVFVYNPDDKKFNLLDEREAGRFLEENNQSISTYAGTPCFRD